MPKKFNTKKFDSYWKEITKSEQYVQGKQYVLEHSRLDAPTTRHSLRVAASTAIVSYLADVDLPIGTALTASGLWHDTGKSDNWVFNHDAHINLNDPYTQYCHRRHPYDGWVRERAYRQHRPETATDRATGILALGHHTNFKLPERCYPNDAELDVYEAAGEIHAADREIMRSFSPLLSITDHYDALTHPWERPYMRVKAGAELDPAAPNIVKRAVTTAQESLVEPGHGLSIALIGQVLSKQSAFIEHMAQAA